MGKQLSQWTERLQTGSLDRAHGMKTRLAGFRGNTNILAPPEMVRSSHERQILFDDLELNGQKFPRKFWNRFGQELPQGFLGGAVLDQDDRLVGYIIGSHPDERMIALIDPLNALHLITKQVQSHDAEGEFSKHFHELLSQTATVTDVPQIGLQLACHGGEQSGFARIIAITANVQPGSLRTGDVIETINGQRVWSPESIRSAVQTAQMLREDIILKGWRGDLPLTVNVSDQSGEMFPSMWIDLDTKKAVKARE
jgi:hypothetical protein